MSARLFVAAGFDALATTSGGVAWALGYPDGEQAPWAEVVAATARIVRSAQVPVTADIEAGYGATPPEVGAHVAEIIQAGVVGINLETVLSALNKIVGLDRLLLGSDWLLGDAYPVGFVNRCPDIDDTEKRMINGGRVVELIGAAT